MQKSQYVLLAAALLCGCNRIAKLRASKDAGSSVADASRADASRSPPAAPASAAALADAAPAKPRRPPSDLNVILITVDSLRADMPWAGYARPIAPNLTALEKESVSYTRGYAISSYTSMSLGGLLGGKLPGEMRRDGFFFGTYHKDNVLFPELLQRAGIKTIGVHAHGYFKDAGFQYGFDEWEIVPNLKWSNTTDENVTAPQHVAIAERLLGDPALENRRFFAWLHFLDPHDQYMPHAPEIPSYGRTIRDRYDGEIAFTDKYIGQFVDFVRARNFGARTAIIVTADHGEALGEHKQYSHGFELWENLVRVPFFFFVPGADARHIDTARSGLDLARTICDLMGVLPDASFEGESLVPELYGAPAEPRDVVFDLPTTSDSDRRRAILHDHEKIIAFGNDKYFHMYDLDHDPDELEAVNDGPDFDAMKARYFAFEKTVHDVAPYGCLPDVCLNGAYKKPKDAGK